MSKVTGKFQITLPKRLVSAYGVKVGDDVELLATGRYISLVPVRSKSVADPRDRLREFDRATERQRERERTRALKSTKERGWTREELYTRARSR